LGLRLTAPSPIAQQYKTYDTAVKNDTADYDALAAAIQGFIRKYYRIRITQVYLTIIRSHMTTLRLQDQRDALKTC
jgi:hypothetical protein